MMKGNLLLCRKTDIIQEVDMMGNVLREITNRELVCRGFIMIVTPPI